jgi:hypothetical protein
VGGRLKKKIIKKNLNVGDGPVAQVVEHLLSKHEAKFNQTPVVQKLECRSPRISCSLKQLDMRRQ